MLGTQEQKAEKVLVDKAIIKVGEIATLPEVTVKIIQIVENPKSTARDLHEVIKNDPALSTRLLKVVNSAFYGLPGQIATIDRAIVLLGLSAVKNIAIAASMTRLFHGGVAIEGFSGKDVWRHAISVAVGSRLLTAAQGKPSVEEGFLAGLIHDLGLLVERQVYAQEVVQILGGKKDGVGSFIDMEHKIIGADHQAFGMALATKWRFPAHLCNTIGYHHKPEALADANRGLAEIVHVADILACNAELGFSETAGTTEVSDEMLDLIDISREKLAEIIEELPEQVSMTEAIFSEN